MSRAKSPKYPNYPLKEALVHADAVFDAVRRNPVDRETVAKYMGYSGLSGAADKSLSTMMQYNLLEKIGKGEIRVSQTAVDALHPDPKNPNSRTLALSALAFSPPLFALLKERFPDDVFDQLALSSFLARENFTERAVGPAIKAYTETIGFLKQEGACDSGGITNHSGVESSTFSPDDDVVPQNPSLNNMQPGQVPPTPLNLSQGFDIGFVGTAIRMSGTVSSKAEAAKVIEALQALQALLPNTEEAAEPDSE